MTTEQQSDNNKRSVKDENSPQLYDVIVYSGTVLLDKYFLKNQFIRTLKLTRVCGLTTAALLTIFLNYYKLHAPPSNYKLVAASLLRGVV